MSQVSIARKIYVWFDSKSKQMQTINDLETYNQEIKTAAPIYRAINHRLRQDMLRLIHKSGRITVTELYNKMSLEQSVTSQHLAILRRAGFVLAERDRRFVFYSVNYETLKLVEEQSRKLNQL